MDDRLKQAIDFSNYNITLQNQKQVLKDRYQDELVFYTQGGKFTATKDLVNFVNFLVQSNQTSAVLTDDNGTPFEIKNLEKFLTEVTNVYFSASNKYHTEYSQLIKNRSVSGLLD
jgi:hypothetical protein